MLAIKLQRIGKKHQPSYRLVVAERRSKMAAPPVEDLGSYQPMNKTAHFKKERISYWLGIGAQPTLTAHNLLVKEGVISGAKRAVKMKKAAPAAGAVEAKEAAAPAAVVGEAVTPLPSEALAKDGVAETPATETATAAPPAEAETGSAE